MNQFLPGQSMAGGANALAPFDYYTNRRIAERGGVSLQPAESAALTTQGAPLPETLENPMYVPGYLRTQIGKIVRVEFYIGAGMTDRVGTLLEVGASYILLEELSGAAVIMCDLFSIKFVTIINADVGDDAIIIP